LAKETISKGYNRLIISFVFIIVALGVIVIIVVLVVVVIIVVGIILGNVQSYVGCRVANLHWLTSLGTICWWWGLLEWSS
jgi:hypothetical protein